MVTGLDLLFLEVNNLEDSVSFYRDQLGFEAAHGEARHRAVALIGERSEIGVDIRNKLVDQERLERLEAVKAIRQGLRDVEEGRVYDAEDALEKLRIKLGLSR